MTDLSAEYKALADYRPTHKVRFVTAAALFDGHDAAINIMRRILQGMGAEVIHLGHNRSVDEVVTAALQEDVQGIAISSYQGGHVEYFKYMVDLLRERGGGDIQVFGGGGGVIVRVGDPRAAGLRRGAHLQPRGRPAHGPGRHDRRDGDALRRRAVGARADCARRDRRSRTRRPGGRWRGSITALENGRADAALLAALHERARAVEGAGAGHHRHRRRRQVEPDRRADPPPAARPGRRAAHRRHQHRPVAAQERRRAAGRPHPHERDRPVEPGPARVHAQPGHARGRQRAQRRAARRDRRGQGGGLRPGRSSRPRASARATPPSCRWSTCRCT